jgi:hypothetical protein
MSGAGKLPLSQVVLPPRGNIRLLRNAVLPPRGNFITLPNVDVCGANNQQTCTRKFGSHCQRFFCLLFIDLSYRVFELDLEILRD